MKILAVCLVLVKINKLSMSWPAHLNRPHILAAFRKNRGVIWERSKENCPETHPRQPKLLCKWTEFVSCQIYTTSPVCILHLCFWCAKLGGLLLWLMFFFISRVYL